jgi:hypothetical protein
MVRTGSIPTGCRARLIAGLVAVLGSVSLASAATINFTNAGGSGSYGNSLTFADSGISVTVSAWAETGSQTPANSGYYLFQTAQVWSWSTGLGICNRNEGTANNSCDNNEHELDSVGRDDLMVFYFDQVVNFANLQVTVDPYDGSGSDPNDRDVRYWVSTAGAAPSLGTFTFNTLSPTFGTGFLSPASSSYNPITHNLAGGGGGTLTGNLLFISGNYLNRNCTNSNISGDSECEAYKITNLTVSMVPVPAALWMFGPALGAIGWARFRGKQGASRCRCYGFGKRLHGHRNTGNIL